MSPNKFICHPLIFIGIFFCHCFSIVFVFFFFRHAQTTKYASRWLKPLNGNGKQATWNWLLRSATRTTKSSILIYFSFLLLYTAILTFAFVNEISNAYSANRMLNYIICIYFFVVVCERYIKQIAANMKMENWFLYISFLLSPFPFRTTNA